MRYRTLLAIALAIPGAAATAQEVEAEDDSVYVDQAIQPSGSAPAASVYGRNPGTQSAPRRTSSEQAGGVVQIASTAEAEAPVAQLTEAEFSTLLSQLSGSERQVLLETVEGRDVCSNPPDIPAVRQLCANRLETRSREFAQGPRNRLSPEERLLGQALDGANATTLDRAIQRLARNTGAADDADNQAVASVALGANTPPPEQPGEEPAGAGQLSAETQALIEAIVNQLGGPGGNP